VIGIYDRNLLSVNENIKDMNYQVVIKILIAFRVIAEFKDSRIQVTGKASELRAQRG